MVVLNLSLNELKLIAKGRDIKGYKRLSNYRLWRTFFESESVKESEKNFHDKRIEKIRFSKSKLKEIRRRFYEIKNKKNLWKSKIKETETNLLELKNNFFKLKKYFDYDDIEYKGIRDLRNLLKLSINDYCYKPIITNDTFNSNYIEYKSKGIKIKSYQLKNVLIW